MACWWAAQSSSRVCLGNEISIEFQPFNMLDVRRCEGNLRNLSPRLQTSTGIKILTCKAFSPMQMGRLLPFVCLFSFVWRFPLFLPSCFSVWLSLCSLLCLSAYSSLPGDAAEKRLRSGSICCTHAMRPLISDRSRRCLLLHWCCGFSLPLAASDSDSWSFLLLQLKRSISHFEICQDRYSDIK